MRKSVHIGAPAFFVTSFVGFLVVDNSWALGLWITIPPNCDVGYP